jgi:hypothetical protein
MTISKRTALPAGLPSWITLAAIEDTITTFQPDYAQEMTVEDAVAILLNVGSLFSVLKGDRHAKI